MNFSNLLVMFVIGAIIVFILTMGMMKANVSARSGTSFLSYCGNYELTDFSIKLSSLINSNVDNARIFYSKNYQKCFPPKTLKIKGEELSKLFCCDKTKTECGFDDKITKKACKLV